MAHSRELSDREQEVVKQLIEGKSNKQIASALNISNRTVEFHLKNIYDKLQVASRVELVLKLGESTVADEAETAVNRDSPTLRDLAANWRGAVSVIGKELKMSSLLNASARDQGAPTTFFDAIRVCLTKYADFTGRAARPEFWWFALAVTLVAGGLAYLSETAASVFLVAVLLPFLAAGTRRLHDCGRSGWWLLFLLAPVAGFVVVGIVWALPSVDSLAGDATPT